MLSKLFESILLSRKIPEVEGIGFTLATQTAFKHGVSCEDVTFSVFITVSHFVRHGNTVFQNFYDLEKAFDSVGCCIFEVCFKRHKWQMLEVSALFL